METLAPVERTLRPQPFLMLSLRASLHLCRPARVRTPLRSEAGSGPADSNSPSSGPPCCELALSDLSHQPPCPRAARTKGKCQLCSSCPAGGLSGSDASEGVEGDKACSCLKCVDLSLRHVPSTLLPWPVPCAAVRPAQGSWKASFFSPHSGSAWPFGWIWACVQAAGGSAFSGDPPKTRADGVCGHTRRTGKEAHATRSCCSGLETLPVVFRLSCVPSTWRCRIHRDSPRSFSGVTSPPWPFCHYSLLASELQQ